MHNYDYEYWKEIDELTWNQLKRCAKQVIYTLMGLAITIALQPVRLYEYVRYRWDILHKDEIMIEQESEIRFKNMVETGHI